ncbi:hypothetical protein H6F89_11775 [Cyanobacteria bacterium FACHB-63]|nr:hypothetical protein [Cyanobacteria bacterium FACHB-63]
MLKNAAIATLILSSTALAATLPAHALTLVEYTFETNVVTPATVSTDVTASDFGVTGITPASASSPTGFNAGNPGRAINYQAWGTTSTIDLGKFYSFDITPNSGRSMSLNTLTFDAQRSGTTGPQTIEVRSSLDNYATGLPFTLPTATTTATANGTFTGYTVSLSSPSFQNLTNPVIFRIYGYGATAAGGTLRLDDVILDGSTQAAVPVPFGFTPVWGVAVNGVVFGLRKLRNRQLRSTSESSVKA